MDCLLVSTGPLHLHVGVNFWLVIGLTTLRASTGEQLLYGNVTISPCETIISLSHHESLICLAN